MLNTAAISVLFTTHAKQGGRLAAFSAAMMLALPAFCQTANETVETVFQPIAVPVLHAYATLSAQQTDSQTCWEVLIPERQLLIRENNEKPWWIRNAVPMAGAAMGGVTAGLVFKRHAKAAVFKRWGIPVMLGGAGAGFFLGPGGVAGAVVGGGLAEILGKRKKAKTIGGAIGGALAGKALWEKVFPPAVPPAPGDDPDDDIPVEVFLREQTCGKKINTAFSQSMYRVSYRFNGEEFTTDLPYDPGEALLIGATGEVTGPARIRLD